MYVDKATQQELRMGYGIQKWNDGAVYEGQWVDNKASGRGTFWHAEGDIYVGEFQQDQANGFGEYTHVNGSRYTGQWVNDVQEGEGEEVWADGAKYKGKYTGTQADASSFSFHAVKNLTTAEGGGVALNLPEPFENEDIYKFLCLFSLHGQSKDALAKTQIGGWKYDIVEAGFKCNMTDIQAAIGLVELERYEDDTLVRRREIFDMYSSKLSEYDWANVPVYETDEKISCYHVYMLRINHASEEIRDEIIKKISDIRIYRRQSSTSIRLSNFDFNFVLSAFMVQNNESTCRTSHGL